MVTVRPFAPEEWPLFKTVRLKALQDDPGAFGSNYARESAFTDEEWQARLKNPDAVMFGVFNGAELVGMTGVYIIPEDKATARFVADWLEPNFRGKGITAQMYEARIGWSKARSGIKRMSICFRADNAAARRAGEKHGFSLTGEDAHVWPDGANVPQTHYEMRL